MKDNSSSIFSFKSATPQHRLVLILVLGTFVSLQLLFGMLMEGVSRHKAEELLNQIDNSLFQADYILLGDSVGNQVGDPYAETDPSTVSFTTNQAIETPGNYFIIKRYLEKNRAPKAVVWVGLDTFGGTLSGPYTETYVQRTFLRWNEIAQLARDKSDFLFSLKMILYKLLPTYRFNLEIQKEFFGVSESENVAIASSNINADSQSSQDRLQFGEVDANIIAGEHGREVQPGISTLYFERMLDLLQSHSVDFFFIPAASSPVANYTPPISYLKSLQSTFQNLHVLTNHRLRIEDSWFRQDHIHYTGHGVDQFLRTFRDEMQVVKRHFEHPFEEKRVTLHVGDRIRVLNAFEYSDNPSSYLGDPYDEVYYHIKTPLHFDDSTEGIDWMYILNGSLPYGGILLELKWGGVATAGRIYPSSRVVSNLSTAATGLKVDEYRGSDGFLYLSFGPLPQRLMNFSIDLYSTAGSPVSTALTEYKVLKKLKTDNGTF